MFASKGKGAVTVGGGSTALSAASFGQLSIGGSNVLYGLETRDAAGTYVIAHANDLATTGASGHSRPFTTAFKVPDGAADIDSTPGN